MQRKVEVKNDTILKALKKKDEYVAEMLKTTDRLSEIEKEAKKLSAKGDDIITKLQREEEKIRPEIEREIEPVELGEYEELSKIYIDKEGDGGLYFEIVDRLKEEEVKLEKFKKDFKKKSLKKKDEEPKPSDNGDSDKEEGKGKSIKDGGDKSLVKAW